MPKLHRDRGGHGERGPRGGRVMTNPIDVLTTAENPGEALERFAIACLEVGMDATPGAEDDHAQDFGLGVESLATPDMNNGLGVVEPGRHNVATVVLDNGHAYEITVTARRFCECPQRSWNWHLEGCTVTTPRDECQRELSGGMVCVEPYGSEHDHENARRRPGFRS